MVFLSLRSGSKAGLLFRSKRACAARSQNVTLVLGSHIIVLWLPETDSRIRTPTKGLTAAPIRSQSCRYQESRDDLIDPLGATVHACDSSRGSHRPPMSGDCRLLVGASAGAPSRRGGNLLIIIRYLRCECEGYTAHQFNQSVTHFSRCPSRCLYTCQPV